MRRATSARWLASLGLVVVACGSKYGEADPSNAGDDAGSPSNDGSASGGDASSGGEGGSSGDASPDSISSGPSFCAARQTGKSAARYCADFDHPGGISVLWQGVTPMPGGLRVGGGPGLVGLVPTMQTSPPNALLAQSPPSGPEGGNVAFSVAASSVVDVTFSVEAVSSNTTDVMRIVFDNQSSIALRLTSTKGASIAMQPAVGAGGATVGLNNSPSFASYRRIHLNQTGTHLLVEADGAKVVDGDYMTALPTLPRAFDVVLGTVKSDGPATVHVDDVVVE